MSVKRWALSVEDPDSQRPTLNAQRLMLNAMNASPLLVEGVSHRFGKPVVAMTLTPLADGAAVALSDGRVVGVELAGW